MKKIILTTLFFNLILITWTFSQENEELKKNQYNFDGVFNATPWFNDSKTTTAEYNLKARIRLNGWVNVTKDGCIKVHARITTGDKLNNEFINTGLGTQEADFSLSLRQLYVSSSCFKKYTMEAGAVVVRNFGNMGLSSNGYIDGLQVYIDNDSRQQFIINIGQVVPEANLLSRGMKKINHISLQANQQINDKLSAFISLGAYEDLFITRSGLSMILSKYLKWIKDVGLEGMMMNDNYLGTMVYANFKISGFENRLVLSKIDDNTSESEKLAFQRKQFYGYGHNILLETSKKLKHEITLNARFRFGEAGPLIQMGITKNIFLPKK